jgi:hypothetical protein
MSAHTKTTIDAALAVCEAEARSQGWGGEWEPLNADMDYVAKCLGRRDPRGKMSGKGTFSPDELEHIGVSKAFWSQWLRDEDDADEAPADPVTWSVIADNGGGLHLYVLRGDDVIFAGEHKERDIDGLVADIRALRDGDTTSTWDRDPDADAEASHAQWDTESGRNGGWRCIADETGFSPAEKITGHSGRELAIALGVYQASDFE